MLQHNIGELCLPAGMPKYFTEGGYLECVLKTPGVGEWVRKTCPLNSSFDPMAQSCKKSAGNKTSGKVADDPGQYKTVQRQVPVCPSKLLF